MYISFLDGFGLCTLSNSFIEQEISLCFSFMDCSLFVYRNFTISDNRACMWTWFIICLNMPTPDEFVV